MFKKPGVYINIVLSLVAIVFVINAFNLPGHKLVKQAMATIGAITGEGTATTLSRFAGASGASTTVGSSIIYDDGTKIGIGTASPTYKLDVNGSINGTSVLVNGVAVGGGGSQWTTTGSDIYYNTGNVGIGMDNPAQKLSVAGTIESTSGGIKFPDGTTQTSAATSGNSVMYLLSAYSLTPASCPTGWTEADYATKWNGSNEYDNIRTCYRSGSYAVMYLHNRNATSASCPSTWTEADYILQGTPSSNTWDHVRTCFK